MPRPRFSSEEICRLGKALYTQKLKAVVETEENIGKLIAIDIETGDYAIGDDDSLEAPHLLQSRHPGAALYTARIGYDAVYALGGIVERTAA